MRITVVICTYNRAHFLEGLYKSITAQTLSPNEYEILFVNNNSTDNTANVIESFRQQNPQVRCVLETQQGLSYARNRGIAESRAPYICFADDDALLKDDYLANMCDYLDNHPKVYEVGGPIFLHYLGAVPKWENPYMISLFSYFYPSSHEYLLKGKGKRYPIGCNMVFRKAAFEKCGGFSTGLGRKGTLLLGGEEKDMAYRLLERHLDVAYIPNAIVYHLVPEERTTQDYIHRQAIGIGKSERFRTKYVHGGYAKRLFSEAVKWAATIVLWVKYMIMCKPCKANMLVKFRYWVTKGLLDKQ